MDVLIESTRSFEADLDKLGEDEKAIAVKKINYFVNLFSTQKADFYRKLDPLPLLSDLNGYESSLYELEVSPELRTILAVDEDPIFGQVIFTLFRVVKRNDLNKAHKDVADALYQDLLHRNQETVQTS